MRDIFNKMVGRNRYVGFRLFLHLGGSEVAPILGVLNSAAPREEDDINDLGERLVEICESLLEYDDYWLSATNEGEVYSDENEVAQYIDELFIDSSQRYGSGIELNSDSGFDQPLSIPVTRNVVVIITVVYTGEAPDLETDLSNISALQKGLKSLIQLHYQNRLLGFYLHFSPSRLGEELTNDQLLQYYPELIPL
ncbi:MAG: DUF1517 domain-containing protein [Nostoc sp. DedQUE12a]|nr:DUF1517 domain-containing protein [Nostoc sp. DedQUE12a]